MKAFKYLLLAFTLITPIALPTMHAQDKPKGEGKGGMRGGDHLKMMTEQLGLTDDQVAKIKPIVEDEGKAMKALRDDTSIAQEDKRGKMREIRQAHASQIRTLLTPEQQAKFDSMGPGPGGKGKGKGKDKAQP